MSDNDTHKIQSIDLCFTAEVKNFLLETDPGQWSIIPKFEICRQSTVVLKMSNGGTERGVALVTEFRTSKLLTRDDFEFRISSK
jgi:hypothetical protein